MAKLKCPACKTPLLEPLPERCPTCQLEGLNRMFLTFEDYEDWKKNVLNEHIKKWHNHRVSIGHDGVLLLLGDGRLFGFGNNEQGQYCSNHIGQRIDKPEKIADNVISAAAGYNYSIYLDSDGKVHLLGNSGIPFKERFNQGNLKFKEVGASSSDYDWFYAFDESDVFYHWGYSLRLVHRFDEIYFDSTDHKKTLLKVFEPIKTTCFHKFRYYYATNGDCVRYGGTDEYLYDKTKITLTNEYKLFVERYGECNLEIHLSPIKSSSSLSDYLGRKNIGPNRHGGGGTDIFAENIIVRPEVYLVNRYTFLPKKEESYKKDLSYLRDYLKFGHFPLGIFEELLPTYKKCDFFHKNMNDNIWFFLDTNGKCNIYSSYQIEWISCYVESKYKTELIAELRDVADFSIDSGKGVMYFIDYSMRVWRLNCDDVRNINREQECEIKKLLHLFHKF